MKRLALLLALAACGPSTPPADPGNTGGGSFDERQACTADSDCAMVELACCDHCNGGHAVGIHRDYLAEIKAAYTAKACEGEVVTCTEKGCNPPKPVCSNSVCGLVFDGRTQVDPLPPPP